MCTTQFLNSTLEPVDTPSVDNILRQGIPSVYHSLREENVFVNQVDNVAFQSLLNDLCDLIT